MITIDELNQLKDRARRRFEEYMAACDKVAELVGAEPELGGTTSAQKEHEPTAIKPGWWVRVKAP
jgi:hypothetical protein